MKWAVPQFSRRQVDAAGKMLLESPQDVAENDIDNWIERFDEALEIINNWRAAHAYPLQCLKMTLRSRAKGIDPTATVAQRLKRLSSIEAKLKRFKHMALSQMQDIGGCRAVVRNVSMVRQLVSGYEKSAAKNPKKRAEFVEKYDYICCPKTDGYRGVHLVYKYRSGSSHHKVYNGLRIEIQLRSRVLPLVKSFLNIC